MQKSQLRRILHCSSMFPAALSTLSLTLMESESVGQAFLDNSQGIWWGWLVSQVAFGIPQVRHLCHFQDCHFHAVPSYRKHRAILIKEKRCCDRIPESTREEFHLSFQQWLVKGIQLQVKTTGWLFACPHCQHARLDGEQVILPGTKPLERWQIGVCAGSAMKTRCCAYTDLCYLIIIWCLSSFRLCWFNARWRWARSSSCTLRDVCLWRSIWHPLPSRFYCTRQENEIPAAGCFKRAI